MPLSGSSIIFGLLLGIGSTLHASDWPQLQHDAARTGHTSDSVAPPYRARWIWLGPNLTLRSEASASGERTDLTSRDGYSFPLPSSVSFTLADSVQPVVAAGRLFIGSMEGGAYAIQAKDGATLWTNQIPGGTTVSAAVAENVAVFVTLEGKAYGFETGSGKNLWQFSARKSITGAPCVVGTRVFIASQDRRVYALNARDGTLLWQSQPLNALIQGGLAADDASIYVGAEDMTAYALNQSNGSVRATHRVRGQSFRLLHPVVHGGFVFFQTGMVPAMGSEYINDRLLADATSLAEEESIYERWLKGDSNGGRWPNASPDFQHLFALKTTDLSDPFLVLCGPNEGVGLPPNPPCVDGAGRVLCWWPTRFPKLTKVGAFGMKHSMDIAAVNLDNGHRSVIDNGKLSGMWPGPESDNLYALSVGGDYLWLRQHFRGTENIRLSNSDFHFVSSEVRHRDGGNFNADIVYADQQGTLPQTFQRPTQGRTAVVISGDCAYIAENFCVTAIEHKSL